MECLVAAALCGWCLICLRGGLVDLDGLHRRGEYEGGDCQLEGVGWCVGGVVVVAYCGAAVLLLALSLDF